MRWGYSPNNDEAFLVQAVVVEHVVRMCGGVTGRLQIVPIVEGFVGDLLG